MTTKNFSDSPKWAFAINYNFIRHEQRVAACVPFSAKTGELRRQRYVIQNGLQGWIPCVSYLLYLLFQVGWPRCTALSLCSRIHRNLWWASGWFSIFQKPVWRNQCITDSSCEEIGSRTSRLSDFSGNCPILWNSPIFPSSMVLVARHKSNTTHNQWGNVFFTLLKSTLSPGKKCKCGFLSLTLTTQSWHKFTLGSVRGVHDQFKKVDG